MGQPVTALPPDPVAAQVERNSIKPGRELRLPLEAWQRPERPEKRLLTDVACVLLAADDPVRQGVNRPFPSQDELIETVHVAAPRAGDELLIGPRHEWRIAVRMVDKTAAGRPAGLPSIIRLKCLPRVIFRRRAEKV